jgi:uncharacterized SAM-binding protein YcdF (DUF218 family)
MKKGIFWIIISSICLILILVTGFEYNNILKSVWNFLVVNDEPKPADVIIVLSGGTDRIEEGVILFNLGYASKILFSGDGSTDMANQAESLGVPQNNILIENNSESTFENAKFSAAIMKAHGFKSAIVVTSPYHTRRASILFAHFFSGWNLTICSVPFPSSNASNWWKNPYLERTVISEYVKLGLHYILPDT